jgi:hypothetical protein
MHRPNIAALGRTPQWHLRQDQPVKDRTLIEIPSMAQVTLYAGPPKIKDISLYCSWALEDYLPCCLYVPGLTVAHLFREFPG